MTSTTEVLSILSEFGPNARNSAIQAKLKARAMTERLAAENARIDRAHEEIADKVEAELNRVFFMEAAE